MKTALDREVDRRKRTSHNGWNQEDKTTDHGKLMSYVLRLSVVSLAYVGSDAMAAYQANPNGDKAGYYLDLAHYCGMRQRGNL